jgi:hypothetical protein
MTPTQLFDRVVEMAPSFEAVRRAHIDAFDDLLPHLLIADVLRYLDSHFSGVRFEGAEPPTVAEMQQVLSLLDLALADGDEATQNAIAVSFVEGIEEQPHFDRLNQLLGPGLRDELERQNKWRP